MDAIAANAVRQGYRGMISFGVAGGLAAHLREGDWVVASAVRDSQRVHPTDANWSRKLLGLIRGAIHAPVIGVDAPVAEATEKRELHYSTGAAAVDMESHVVARVAAAHKIAFAAVHVIVDPAFRINSLRRRSASGSGSIATCPQGGAPDRRLQSPIPVPISWSTSSRRSHGRSRPERGRCVETLFLKPSDGLASEALQYFLTEREFLNPGSMRTSWSRFVLSLMIRYPEAVAHMKTQLRGNVEKIYEQTRKPEEPEKFADYEAQHGTRDMARVHERLLMDLMQDSRMGRLIFRMHWGVLKCKNYTHNLLTSDRPIVSNAFRLSAHHLCLPISPAPVFVACATPDAEAEFMRLNPLDVMFVMNDAVTRQTNTCVWSTDDRQLRFVKNRMGKSKGPVGAYLV